MTVDQLINLLVTITLIEMMVAIGFSVTIEDFLGVMKNGSLIVRALFANYVCVPVATLVLLRLFDPHPLVSVGFLILAVCPGAPYGPPFSAVAKGNVPMGVGLMVLLAGSSAIFAPLLLGWLLPFLSVPDAPRVDVIQVVSTLLLTQLIPLCVGITVRRWRPAIATRLQKPANLTSKVLNLATVGVILVVQFQLLSEIRFRGFLGMLALLAASWIAGSLLGGLRMKAQKTMAVTTSLKNVSVGLVIATRNFPGTPAVTAVVAYGLISLFGTLLLAWIYGSWFSQPQIDAHLDNGNEGD